MEDLASYGKYGMLMGVYSKIRTIELDGKRIKLQIVSIVRQSGSLWSLMNSGILLVSRTSGLRGVELG